MKKGTGDGSPSLSVNKEDMTKVGKGVFYAAMGGALTYASEIVLHIDWGEWTPIVVALASVLSNFAWKFLRNKK